MTRTSIHGFASWVDFIKATLSLGATIGELLYAGLLFGLDGRYAAKTVEVTVTEAQSMAVSLRQELRETRAKIISGQLFDSRVAECQATDQAARVLYAERVAELELEYQSVTGRTYRVTDCDTLR